jgi:hypothetical protein
MTLKETAWLASQAVRLSQRLRRAGFNETADLMVKVLLQMGIESGMVMNGTHPMRKLKEK